MRKIVFLIIIFGFSVVGLFAQGTAMPFTKRPVSQAEYAKAVETNDQKVLNLECMSIVKTMNTAFGLSLRDCSALAGHIRKLTTVICPQVSTTLGRVLKNGNIDMVGWKRLLRPTEMCLVSDNRVELSLDCGNPIPNLFVTTIATATPRVAPPALPTP